ncbi:MAG: divergent polysaccharide deacetylase family protein [Caulobacterales bacterium]
MIPNVIRWLKREKPARRPNDNAARPKGPRIPLFGHPIAALVACLAVAGAGIGAIQVFGDPSAAGPREFIQLAPGPAHADAAPHISFSELAEAGAELDPMLETIPVDDLPHGAEPADGTGGQVQISMVESDVSRPQNVRPLPRAPIPALLQNGMPIVAPDGRTSSRVYARPFSGDGSKPKIAIIIGGLGFNARQTTQAIDELPSDVTLSFVPYAQNLQSWIDRARARGHEVMLELPMEPFDPNADDTGPQTLMASRDTSQNIPRLENLLGRASGYFGVTNYQGARFASSAQASAPVVAQLRRRGLSFIATGIGQRTALSVEAARAGLQNTAADRIIDARREADSIDEQLLNLEALALQNGAAIGAGFAYPVTMVQVAEWASEISSRGYALAPASAVLAQRAAPRR